MLIVLHVLIFGAVQADRFNLGPPTPLPSYPGGVWGVPWRFFVPHALCWHRLCRRAWALLYGGCDCVDLGNWVRVGTQTSGAPTVATRQLNGQIGRVAASE